MPATSLQGLTRMGVSWRIACRERANGVRLLFDYRLRVIAQCGYPRTTIPSIHAPPHYLV
jgi:hypothetical protein